MLTTGNVGVTSSIWSVIFTYPCRWNNVSFWVLHTDPLSFHMPNCTKTIIVFALASHNYSLICGWQAFCEVPSSRSIHKSMSSSFPGRCVCLEGVAAVPQPYSISSNFPVLYHRCSSWLAIDSRFTISAVWQQFQILSATDFHVAQAWSTLQLYVWWFLLVVNVTIEWFALKCAPGLEIFRVHIACASVTVSTPWGFRSACIQC